MDVRELCFDGSAHHYVFISRVVSGKSDPRSLSFRICRFGLSNSALEPAIKRHGGDSVDADFFVVTNDPLYYPVRKVVMEEIYNNSGLKNNKYKDDVFDCEYFAFVFKGEANRDAYSTAASYGYAVGEFYGESSPTEGHTAIIYVNWNLEVYIYEPQNGTEVQPNKWYREKNKPKIILKDAFF